MFNRRSRGCAYTVPSRFEAHVWLGLAARVFCFGSAFAGRGQSRSRQCLTGAAVAARTPSHRGLKRTCGWLGCESFLFRFGLRWAGTVEVAAAPVKHCGCACSVLSCGLVANTGFRVPDSDRTLALTTSFTYGHRCRRRRHPAGVGRDTYVANTPINLRFES